ncbi:MAG: TIGR04086 family membrane protein [Eubacteriales bacterium]|nr:TIGR04086 family membrane protein [Eubacteriales bacterium]
MRSKEYTKVWGDTVCIIELFFSGVIGILITMGIYLGLNFALSNYTTLEPKIVSGYALMGGIIGCFISGLISGRRFKPKRQLIEGTERMDLQTVLEEAGTSIEIEREALKKADAETIAEMESLELYSLLSLIPEGNVNYKPEYKKYVERKSENDN